MGYKLFPPVLLDRASSGGIPELVGVLRTPGRTGSGVMPMGRSDGGGLWTASFESISVRTPAHQSMWQALRAYLAEGAMPIIVPFCLKLTMPAPIVDGRKLYSYGSIPHSDGSFFSDGSGYYQPVVDVVLEEAAELRATTLLLRRNYAGDFIGGEFFSLPHEELSHRLYNIVTTTVDDDDPDLWTVTIDPPLREDTDVETVPDFTDPKCVMNLAGGGAMTQARDLRKFGKGSIRFVESFLPAPDDE